MKYKRILFLTDNEYLYSKTKELLSNKLPLENFDSIHFRFSCNNTEFIKKYAGDDTFSRLNIKSDCDKIIEEYDLVFSLHCKQIFPKKLVDSIMCINVHPGFNPYNRGWFPQVFSIINGMPLGATIHVMDEQLDHGPIIAQQQLPIYSWDTSISLYNKILSLELDLLDKNIISIIGGNFKTMKPSEEGNVNFKSDFNKLKQIDINHVDTFKNFIDHIRALTHESFKNCFFYDEKGNKIYVRIILEKENNDEPQG